MREKPARDRAGVSTLVTFSLLALSIVGGSILTDRMGHTWDRVRATAARPAEPAFRILASTR